MIRILFYVCRHTCGSRLIQRTNNLLLTKSGWGIGYSSNPSLYRLSPQSFISGLNALEYPSSSADKKVTNLSDIADKSLKQLTGKGKLEARIRFKEFCGCGEIGRHARFGS